MRKQVGDLCFQSPCVDDLTEGSVGGERQQISGNIESPCFQRTVIALLLHLGGLGRSLCKVAEHAFRKRFVFREKFVDGVSVEFPCCVIRSKLRNVITAFPEILVSRRALLTIPPLLVGDDDGGQDREFFDGKSYVCEVRNRPVPVLEVKSV